MCFAIKLIRNVIKLICFALKQIRNVAKIVGSVIPLISFAALSIGSVAPPPIQLAGLIYSALTLLILIMRIVRTGWLLVESGDRVLILPPVPAYTVANIF